MKMKFRLKTIITALLCSVMLLGCSNLIEDLKDKTQPDVPRPDPVIEVTSVTLDKTATVTVGSKITLTATVLPANATDKTVVWTSSDESVATVVNGVITGVKAGSVTITATAGGKSASCTVTVKEPAEPYLTFKGNGEFTLGCEMNKIKVPGSWDGTVEYSTDKTNWTEWDGWAPIPAAAANGNYFIYLRGKNTTFSKSIMEVTGLLINGSATEVECTGNIMTLLDWENPSSATMGDRCFDTLFSYCTKLTKAPDLPATTLSVGCYCGMFLGCTSLKTAPELPAVTLANNCYDSMFQNCTSLTEAPELPVENLSDNCYRYMFYNCTSLVNTPALPAAELTNRCYEYMFSGCTGLKSIGKIGKGNTVNVTAESAMDNMFSDCTELKIVETTDTDEDKFISIGSITGANAVDGMFDGCATGSATATAGKSYKIETPYLIFKGNGAFSLGNKGVKGWNGTVEYSTDKTTWTEWDGATAIPAVVASNGSYYIYLRGKNNTYISSWSNKTILNFTGDATSVECNGNIMTLLDWENPDTATMDELCFVKLFSSCEKLTKGPDLPSMNLSDACYYQMFEECTALITAPKLPATTLTESCYYYMFIHCTSLEASPELPATTVIDSCYSLMFAECTSLSSIGKISAKVIDKNFAMQDMFYECSNIKVVETTNPDEAFLTIESVDGALTVDKMFYGTKGSVETPVAGKSYKIEPPFVASNYLTFEGNGSFTLGINGTADGSKQWDGKVYYSTNKTKWNEWDGSNVASSAVSGGKTYVYLAGTGNTHFAILDSDSNLKPTIFSLEGAATGVACSGNIMSLLDCENVNTVTMGDLSFACLFNGCTKLTKAPDLPATTLSMGCYYEMFKDCTSLETAPVLNAGTLTDSCYTDMFNGCTSLKTAPVLNAMSLGDYCYWGMFSGCTSLTASPALPASVLAEACYREMFRGCTSLTSPGKITATQSDKDFVMYEMFIDCSSLKVVEAESGEESFFTFTDYGGKWTVGSMFEGCATGSVEAPTPGKSYKYVIE